MNLGAARLVDLASQQREPGALQGSLVQELQQVKADITAQLSAAEAEVRAEFETAAERWGRQQADQQAELQAAVEGRISEHCSTLLRQHDDKTSSDGGGSDDEHGGAAGLITCPMRERHFCRPDSAEVHMEANHPELVGVSDEGREAPAPAPAGVLAVKPDPAWRQRLVLAMAHPDDEAAWEAFGILDSNSIGDNGATALAGAAQHWPNLQYLDLCNNNIGDRGATELAKAARHWPNLRYFLLHKNNINGVGRCDLDDAAQLH
ncbi:hypothetical protein COO60DRAFT_1646767 [Scenedesmus sp. NREL 46B-D3]|nr:hypothetical protein COO60DRAFT_1646767 [Scenedesmus sp. NREL 46B-D3]